MAGEFYLNAINVMRGAEGLSTYAPIDEAEKFRIEYWALEEAKLQRLPKPKPLASRIALVTGAASGIGKAIATRLAAEGACVVIADLDAEKAQAAAAEIGGSDVAVGIAANVTDEDAVQGAVDATVLAFGGLDIVINNAGLSLSKALLDTTVADWDLQHNVMAKGSFLVSRAAYVGSAGRDLPPGEPRPSACGRGFRPAGRTRLPAGAPPLRRMAAEARRRSTRRRLPRGDLAWGLTRGGGALGREHLRRQQRASRAW